MEFDPDIAAFYGLGKEDGRLNGEQHGLLEFARTQELIGRFLPPPPLRVLDVGGGPGAYAVWLRDLGYEVELLDPMPLHVEQARRKSIPAQIGDARVLPYADESADAVLMLGPMYHLVSRDDRLLAWREALRVARPGGVIFTAAISRFAALFDLLLRLDKLGEDGVFKVAAISVTTGEMTGAKGLFTRAYLHRPAELRAEADEAGLVGTRLFNIEGMGFAVHNFAERWADPARRAALLQVARLTEEDPDVMAAASHLLVMGHKAATP